MGKNQVIRYSEVFKIQVVRELVSGHLRSQEEARERYGIRGASTVSRWVRKYGPSSLQTKVVRVETTEERSQIAALKGRVRDLERALIDSKVQESLHKASFDLVCEVCGVADPAALKKNIAERLSNTPGNTPAPRQESR